VLPKTDFDKTKKSMIARNAIADERETVRGGREWPAVFSASFLSREATDPGDGGAAEKGYPGISTNVRLVGRSFVWLWQL